MKLFVGNLSWNVTGDDLFDLFEAFGTVHNARVILDRDTGKSRGFGFVEMATISEGQIAIRETEGRQYMGRHMVVNEAKERPKPLRQDYYHGDRY